MRFALAALKCSIPFTDLCRTFGISRKSGYKWLQRFRSRGRQGLRDGSRRPRRSIRLAARWRRAVARIRRRHPSWGAKKIRAQLRRLHPHRRLPVARTITRWLQQMHLVPPRRRRSPRGPALTGAPLSLPHRPNAVWTADFKGCFRTRDGRRCDPLTVRDLFSRFVLTVCILPNQNLRAVRAVFVRLFRRYGLPDVIRVDNGSPFAGGGAQGLSALSVWWVRLDIRVEFIRPGHPEDNGAHEQMHRVLKRETARPPAATVPAQQQRIRRWVQLYNEERPHEALGQCCPVQRYGPSRRHYGRLAPVRYRRGWAVRRVRSNGQIKWQGRRRFIGEAFAGQSVGLRAAGPGQHQVYFAHLLLGELRESDLGGIRPTRVVRPKR